MPRSKYLISLSKEATVGYVADLSKAHGSIVKVSLAYLSEISTYNNLSQRDIYAEFPLAGYSSRYWLRHARISDNLLGVKEAVIRFLLGRKDMENMDLIVPPRPDYARVPTDRNSSRPLYCASLAGLTNTVAELLEKGADVHAQGGYFGNALQAALVRRHEPIVKLLLEKCMREGGIYFNALYAASAGDHQRITKLLLDNGVDVNSKDGISDSTLQVAIYRDHEQIVKLLLDKGADVNTHGGGKCDNRLFYYVLARGQEPMLKLLLDKGTLLSRQCS